MTGRIDTTSTEYLAFEPDTDGGIWMAWHVAKRPCGPGIYAELNRAIADARVELHRETVKEPTP